MKLRLDLRALRSVVALAFAASLGLAAAAALAQGPVTGATGSATAPPPPKTVITTPAPDSAPTVPVPAPDPAPSPIEQHNAAPSPPAALRQPTPTQPAPVREPSREPVRRPVAHRRSSPKPASSASRREGDKRAVGVTAPRLGTPSFGASDSRSSFLYLLFGLVGLSIVFLAATPSQALEKTWVLKSLVDQRPHVAMAGATVVVLTGFAYLLQHWSP